MKAAIYCRVSTEDQERECPTWIVKQRVAKYLYKEQQSPKELDELIKNRRSKNG